MLLISIPDPLSLLLRFLKPMLDREGRVVYVIYPRIAQHGCYETEKSHTSLNPVRDVDLLNSVSLLSLELA